MSVGAAGEFWIEFSFLVLFSICLVVDMVAVYKYCRKREGYSLLIIMVLFIALLSRLSLDWINLCVVRAVSCGYLMIDKDNLDTDHPTLYYLTQLELPYHVFNVAVSLILFQW